MQTITSGTNFIAQHVVVTAQISQDTAKDDAALLLELNTLLKGRKNIQEKDAFFRHLSRRLFTLSDTTDCILVREKTTHPEDESNFSKNYPIALRETGKPPFLSDNLTSFLKTLLETHPHPSPCQKNDTLLTALRMLATSIHGMPKQGYMWVLCPDVEHTAMRHYA